MAKKTRNVLVTPRGRAIYPHLTTPDTRFNEDGVYTVKLAVPTAAAEEMIQKIDQCVTEAIEKAKKDNPKIKKIKESDLPYKLNEENEEETVFNFKTKAKIKVKDEIVNIRPKLFDSKGKPCAKDIRIGGGSVLRVSFEPCGFYTAMVGAGATLRLNAVQVIELKEWQRGADSFGFGEEADGYSADADSEMPAEESTTTDSPAQTEETTSSASDGSDF